MNLEDIRNNVIKSAKEKLNRHRIMGAKTSLSITEVAELLDIVSGMAQDARVEAESLVGRFSLN